MIAQTFSQNKIQRSTQRYFVTFDISNTRQVKSTLEELHFALAYVLHKSQPVSKVARAKSVGNDYTRKTTEIESSLSARVSEEIIAKN